MKKDTKQRILEVGARIMHQKGYGATGIQEILKEAEVPKGSFYFYFKSKEDFGFEILKCFSEHFQSSIGVFINDEKKTHMERLKSFLNEFLSFFTEGDFKGGCPIGNFALELADVNDRFREHLKAIMEEAATILTEQVRLAQVKGEIKNQEDPKVLADFIFFSWEGMIMQMKVKKDKTALKAFNRIVFEQLLQTTR